MNNLQQLEEQLKKARRTVDDIRERRIRFASNAETISKLDAAWVRLGAAMADLSEYRNSLLRTGKRPSGRSPEAIPRDVPHNLSNIPASISSRRWSVAKRRVFNLVDGEGL
jgi:hypothetical protein